MNSQFLELSYGTMNAKLEKENTNGLIHYSNSRNRGYQP